jgi:hypothetical protein
MKIQVLVSPKQYEAIVARAGDLDLTIADYFRSLAKADIQQANREWPEKQPFYAR